jgi:hypothetical protein
MVERSGFNGSSGDFDDAKSLSGDLDDAKNRDVVSAVHRVACAPLVFQGVPFCADCGRVPLWLQASQRHHT